MHPQLQVWNAAAADAPAHLARLVEHSQLEGERAGSATGSDSDDDAWRSHLPSGGQNGSASQNGLPNGHGTSDNFSNTAWLSPLLALNLGLACHLQPFLQPDPNAAASDAVEAPAGGAAPQPAAAVTRRRQQLAGLDAVVIQAFTPAAAESPAATVQIPLPGGGHASVRAADALGLSQVCLLECRSARCHDDCDLQLWQEEVLGVCPGLLLSSVSLTG